jgi:GLPGLI family protein
MKYQVVNLLLILSQLIYSQHPISGVVEYTIESVTPMDSIRLSTQNDSKIAENDKEKFIELISKPAYFVLEFNSYESSYKNNEMVMQSDEDKKNKVSALQIFGGGSNCNYYTNVKDSTTLANIDAFGETLIVTYNFPQWEITNETKKIGNYTCYKAVQKNKNGTLIKNKVVWYTPEIPNQFGPKLYVGLPGMVLEVIRGKSRIIATKITLNNDNTNINIEKPTKGVRLTEEQYKKKTQEIGKQLGF